MQKTFSVIITSFNYADYICDAVDSALSQTIRPLEIIVVDDGSTDTTQSVLASRYSSNKVVRIIKQANEGQLSAIHAGLHATTGNLVALLDADDIWEPNYLESISAIFCSNPGLDVALSNMRIFGNETPRFPETTSPSSYFGITSCITSLSTPYPPWIGTPTSGIVIKRSLLERVIPPRSFFASWKTRADDVIVYGSSILGGVKFYSSQKLVQYRTHGGNTFFNKTLSPVERYRYYSCVAALVSYFRQLAYGAQSPPCNLIHLEFKTRPRPSLKLFIDYVKLLPRTDGTWFAKAKAFAFLLKHFLICRISHPPS